MLVSFNWLKDFLNLDKQDPYQLAERITRTGVEVPDRIHPEKGMKKLVVGHILDCKKVPGTHLHLTHVDVGQENPLQIVCGAPNVAAGQDVVVALHGARIAHHVKIKKSKIRGMESNGMICGLQEIGFADSVVPEKYANGIFVFPQDSGVKPGDSAFAPLGMDDYILNFDITPNRADTLSMEGSAYEVGAVIDQKPKIEPVSLKEDGPDWTQDLETKVDPKLAPKLYLRKISKVHLGESPLWLQRRLWNAGLRPINNVVDVTNYVMLLTGQPMHAYDARTFKTGKYEVRTAHKGEKLRLLNDKAVNLDPADIIITNGQEPVCMAGVMGGLNSEITAKTTDVILEAAIFDPTMIRRAAFRHANRTEASSRYEKGVNWDATRKAIDIAALLLRNEAGATVNQGLIKATDGQRKPVVVTTTASHINQVLGVKIPLQEIVHIFERLNFGIKVNGERLTVTVPNRRWDVSIPADLVQEVGRLYGYDKLPNTQPLLPETQGGYSAFETQLRRFKQIARGQGLMEIVSYSLTSPQRAVIFNKQPKAVVKVRMPLNVKRSAMRQNVLTGLVDAASYNFAHKQDELHLFEQSRVYDCEGGDFHEREHLAALYSGHTFAANWQHQSQKIDFYYVKGQLTNLFAAVGIKDKDVQYKAEAKIPALHPTRSADIYVQGHFIGVIGMLSHLSKFFDKNLQGHDVYVYELDLSTLVPLLTHGMTAKAAPKFPSIERDLSLVVAKSYSNQEVENVIKSNAGKYLRSLQVIDVYTGEHLEGHDKKSIAYRLTFLNEKDTLTDAVVTKAMTRITAALKNDLSARIR